MEKLPNEYDRYYEPLEDTAVYRCPGCGAVLDGLDEVYMVSGEIVGCDACVRCRQLYEVMEVA